MSYTSGENLVHDLYEKINEITKDILHPNIVIFGKTGVGKSTLINSVFGSELVEVGVGKPITKHLQKIQSPEIPITLYDTKGLELKEEVQEDIIKELVDLVNESRKSQKESEYIHAIWYCIQSGSNRLEPVEENLIKRLTDSVKVPVIIVLTQSFQNEKSEEFKKAIENMNLNVTNIVKVMAQEFTVTEDITVPSYGLDVLVRITYKVLPEAVQKGFINAQKVDLESKIKTAKKIANGYITSTFITGFTPIPVSDAPILALQQVTMLANITATFGLSIEKSILTTVVSSFFGSSSATLAGKFIISNTLKMIPGIATIIGGAVSGMVAATLTAAMSRAYITFMASCVEKQNRGEAMEREEIFSTLNSMFQDELQKGGTEV